jgi:hypothetical protein
VVAAQDVPVHAEVEVVADSQAVIPLVRTALDGLAARRPGARLLAAQVLTAVSDVPGVLAASILRWNRAGVEPAAATSIGAARASWPARSPAPHPAELVAIDGSAASLLVTVAAPEAVAVT